MIRFTVIVQSSQSAHRLQVDQALAERNTDLAAFIEAGKAQGKTFDEIFMDLRHTTGVRFSMRTLYRWANRLDEVSA